MSPLLGVACVLVLSGLAAPVARAGGSIVVDTLEDVAADDGSCSLREAIVAANADTTSGATVGECPAGAGADSISVAIGGVITLSAGLPAINSDVSIDGAGGLTVDGADAHQPFSITSGSVTLTGLSIRGGSGAGVPTQGGGITNAGTLTIADSTVTGNHAEEGGGIWNTGTLIVRNSHVSGNSGGGGAGGGFGGGAYGGAITIVDSFIADNHAGSTGGVGGDVVSITGSTITGNGADGCGGVSGGIVTVRHSLIDGNGGYESGGGVCGQDLTIIDSTVSGNGGTFAGGVEGDKVRILRSTIVDNRAADGSSGGIMATSLLLVDSTVAGNTAFSGAGIDASSVTAVNSTVTRNVADDPRQGFVGTGGGIRADKITLKNTIVAGNRATTSPDIAGTITSRTASLVGVPTGLTLADILDPDGLQDNGGPTQTIALVESDRNPARETGDPAVCAAAPVNGIDQRGQPRPSKACDIGAFELQATLERSPFTDTASSRFYWDIEWLYRSGITKGCTATKFCPTETVTRGQMAAFLDRALALPATTRDYFTDDETSSFEGAINRLAASGITSGCTATKFCPTETVTRGQMAAFLHRALTRKAD